jgi:hypothetical protein
LHKKYHVVFDQRLTFEPVPKYVAEHILLCTEQPGYTFATPKVLQKRSRTTNFEIIPQIRSAFFLVTASKSGESKF